MFHTADPEDIIKGHITDVYFERSLTILKAKGINPVVKAEFIARSIPANWPWAVFAIAASCLLSPFLFFLIPAYYLLSTTY